MFNITWILSELFWPYSVLLLLCYVYVQYSAVNRFIKTGSKQNVLFVTAHPDDECMFFSPTILSLLRENHNVYLVCLSKGDFYGQGDVRKKELLASCAKLGILQSHVTIVEDERFQDGPENKWSTDAIAERVLSVVKRVRADSVVTFDSHGVTGHANHIAVCNGIRKLFSGKDMEDVSVFTLESTNIIRKYMSILDLPMSSIFCTWTFISSPMDVLKSWRAMAAHNSQFVWFRKLYIIFSRYMYVNTLCEMK
ncbi:N-acetylglucosaminyl-phosphatidylinositol de-N-acetylase-like [Mya arenaria]|uniref:N-acetylglucosaminyl-phosphatidylinositol de-N-acetylase-like n=1 Tax=Mya arenaria TaxID=6604 RepID=UPI0022E3C2E1|nr:N-acetylglucosaminyl-phosphatidylinositol de-N-acetylase-like [Mya arenaria]